MEWKFRLGCSLILVSCCSCTTYFERENLSKDTLLEQLRLDSNTGNVKFKENWWHEYKSDQLNKFVDESLKQNLSLKISQARVKEARARADQYNANRYPIINSRYTSIKTKDNAGDVTSSEQYSFVPTYSVDLWGANYSLYQSYENKFLAQEFLAKSAAMTLISEVISTWLQIQFGLQELQILEDQFALYNNILDYQLNNYMHGVLADQDILVNQTAVNNYKTKIYQNKLRISSLKLELAYLIGRPPTDDLKITIQPLEKVISLPKKGISSDLIIDRPDIMSAWYELQASDWSLQNSKLNMLPSFNIALTFSDVALSSILSTWRSIANEVVYNGIDWGRDKADIATQKASFERSIASYLDTVYRAVVEVRNEIIKSEHLSMQIVWLEKQLKLSNSQLSEAKLNAENGGDVIGVVYKKINMQNDKLLLLRETEKINLRRIDLYNALGGNIWTEN
jgi:multidrug efflux system outer membrane protein